MIYILISMSLNPKDEILPGFRKSLMSWTKILSIALVTIKQIKKIVELVRNLRT